MKSEKIRVRNLVIGGFILFLLIYLYQYAGQTFLNACKPLLIGIALAYIMNILIGFFQKHDVLYNRGILKNKRVHDVLSTVIAIIVLLACFSLIVGFIAPQLTGCVFALLDKVPDGIEYVLRIPLLHQLLPAETLESLQQVDWTNWIAKLINIVNSDDLFKNMTATASSTLSLFSTLLFGVMFAVYFTSGREKRSGQIRRMARAFLPDGEEKRFFYFMGMLNGCFHDFIVCQTLQAVIIGLTSSAILGLFHFPYSTMIGVLNGFCALIPVVGGYIGAILGTLMILAEAPQMAFFFLILIIVIQNVVGTLVFPRLVGKSLGLPAVWTLAAVTVGSGTLGMIGILIGVPLAAFGYRVLVEEVRYRERKAEAKAKNQDIGSQGEKVRAPWDE